MGGISLEPRCLVSSHLHRFVVGLPQPMLACGSRRQPWCQPQRVNILGAYGTGSFPFAVFLIKNEQAFCEMLTLNKAWVSKRFVRACHHQRAARHALVLAGSLYVCRTAWWISYPAGISGLLRYPAQIELKTSDRMNEFTPVMPLS